MLGGCCSQATESDPKGKHRVAFREPKVRTWLASQASGHPTAGDTKPVPRHHAGRRCRPSGVRFKDARSDETKEWTGIDLKAAIHSGTAGVSISRRQGRIRPAAAGPALKSPR